MNLTFDELAYLKLFIHNFNDNKIAIFLDIDRKCVYYIKYSIFERFNTRDWNEIICKAFEMGIVKKEDFFPDVIKRVSLVYTEIIFKEQVLKKTLKTKLIEKFLLEFYKCCENELNKESLKDLNSELTSEEVDILRHQFIGIYNEENIILSDMFFFRNIEKNIFFKLNVNNWFNAFRVAFQLNILDKKQYHFININNDITKVAKKIVCINELKGNSDKKYMIYYLLNTLYVNIEFHFLLKRDKYLLKTS
ncbi:hypothetical protein [Thalassobellus citreus]|uniref:hypothetical protein n=1 Tax=Thalassobellus citreus TaxID=3367752 RepID=UPI00379BDA2A